MKRRNFVQNLLLAPVAPAVAAQLRKLLRRKPPLTKNPPLNRRLPFARGDRGPHDVPKLDLTGVDRAGSPLPHYLTAAQFADTSPQVERRSLVPLRTTGRADARHPEFLDFLISASPDDRQNLYRSGLDSLDNQSRDQFQKPFCDLDAQQADRILQPLLVVRPWSEDFPAIHSKSSSPRYTMISGQPL